MGNLISQDFYDLNISGGNTNSSEEIKIEGKIATSQTSINSSQLGKSSQQLKQSITNNIINEIYQTEKDYVHDLDIIYQVFYSPLQNLLSAEEHRILFSDIYAIRELNHKLLQELEDALPDLEQSIPFIFLKLGSFFKVYSIYSANHKRAISFIQELEGKNYQFDEFIKAARQNPDCRLLSLNDFLIKPVQRILKYPLLFKELLKNTPPENEGYASLKLVLESFQEIANYVNKTTLNSENRERVIEIQKDLSDAPENFDLVTPSRIFIMESQFIVYSEDIQDNEMLFLFSDAILFTSLKDQYNQYSFKKFLLLNSSVSISSFKWDPKSFSITEKSQAPEEEEIKITISHKDENVSKTWLEAMKKIQLFTIELEERRSSADLGMSRLRSKTSSQLDTSELASLKPTNKKEEPIEQKLKKVYVSTDHLPPPPDTSRIRSKSLSANEPSSFIGMNFNNLPNISGAEK